MAFRGWLKQSTAVTITCLMIDSSDHITGKTGLAAGITKYLIQAGSSAGAITPTTAEIDATNIKGLYSLALTTAHTNTLGELALHLTASGADPVDDWWIVSARLPDDLAYPATSGRSMVVDAAGLVDANMVKAGPTGSGTAQTARDLGLGIPAAAPGANGGLPTTNGTKLNQTADLTAGQTIAATVAGAVGSVTGNVGGNVVGSVGSVTADVGITQAGADKVWSSAARSLTTFGTLVADMATAVWGAATRTLSAFGFTVATNSDTNVTAIKTQTDKLAFTVANKVDANTLAVGGTTQTARDLGLGIPAASPGANGGLPTTNGTKLNQTVDLTAGQSVGVSGTVTLAATQPNYAPAKAGDAMTLTAAYDAAKAAAQAATALSNATWTDAKAGYLTGAVALEASLTAMKGAGWTTETLKAIDALIVAARADIASLVGTPVFTVLSPVTPSGTIQIVHGYDYSGTHAPTLTIGNTYDLTSATNVEFKYDPDDATALPGAWSVSNPNLSTQAIVWTVPAAAFMRPMNTVIYAEATVAGAKVSLGTYNLIVL
jgi:hypothetical protein